MRSVPSFSKKARFLASSSLLALVFATWAGAGCSSAPATFCNSRCDCEGNCSTSSRETCIKTQEDNEKLSHDAGCGSQWDVFASCVIDRSQCISGKFTTGGCDTETSNLTQCIFKNPGHPCAFVGEAIHCI